MGRYRIVINTNVIVAALRSRRGASYRLLSLVDTGAFLLALSTPMVLEYEDAAKRLAHASPLTMSDIDDILDYLCAVAAPVEVHFRWRPVLTDPKDEMVLELAVAGGCDHIVTFNKADFRPASNFGVVVVTPAEFLNTMEEVE
jgi:putative PIN family toxin of toxin-antitoxin system